MILSCRKLCPKLRMLLAILATFWFMNPARNMWCILDLVEDDVEAPGDVSGVLYVSFGDTNLKQKLLLEIEICALYFNAKRT